MPSLNAFAPASLLLRAKAYARSDMRSDAVAGLTVAVMGVPQAMAYALIANVPPIYGLYTAIISCIIGALFGSSRHLVTGPTNATCMVLFSLSLPYVEEGSHVEVILIVSLMAGVVKLLFGLLRLGTIVRYVSNSVVVGFTAGAGILIAGNQLRNVFGFSIPTEQAGQFFSVLRATFANLEHTNPYALTLAVLTAAWVVLAPRLNRHIPGGLIGVSVSALAVYLLDWNAEGVEIVRDIGEIHREWRIFHVPEFLTPSGFDADLLRNLTGGAVAVALLGLIEAASSARAVAASSGQRLDFSREFTAQGLANIGGAFFWNFAGSGSFTRTALNYKSGGRTRAAAVFSALFSAATILLLAPLANYIPKASLAGMLIVVAASMVDRRRLSLALRSGGNSRYVLFATLAATMILPLHYAIFVGVFLSIVFLLKITGRTDLTLLVPRPADRTFDEIPFEKAVPSPIVLVNMEGDLYFAAVENLDYELHQVLAPETRVVLLRMKRLRAVGSTAMAILEHFWQMLRARDITLVVCGIEPKLEDMLTRSGLRRRIGEQNIFFADNTLFQSTELALARARGVVEMEQQRRAATGARDGMLQVRAREIMSRQILRFGEGHSAREAIWLLSEMQKRRRTTEAAPLFLQNVQGKLSSRLSPWAMLKLMIGDLKPGAMEAMSDAQLGEAFRACFARGLHEAAESAPERLGLEDDLQTILRNTRAEEVSAVPVCDAEGRIAGMIRQDDLLAFLGKALGTSSTT